MSLQLQLIVLTILPLLVDPPAAAPAAPGSLIGSWESVDRTAGGVGEYVEFKPDGTMVQISAAMGDARYRLDGDSLLTFWTDRATGKVSVLANRVELEGEALVQRDEQGNLVNRMERSRSRGKSAPLAGIWCSDDGPGLTTLTEFTEDGRMFVRLPIRSLPGRYWLSGDSLAVELQGSDRREFKYQVKGDEFTIVVPSSSEKRFRRVETSLLAGGS